MENIERPTSNTESRSEREVSVKRLAEKKDRITIIRSFVDLRSAC